MAEGRVVSFWFDNPLDERLSERADELGTTRSAIVKDTLRQAFEMPPPEHPSQP